MRNGVLVFLIIFITGCTENKNTFNKGNYDDYNPADFYAVTGVVYDTHTYFSRKYWETSKDIYYVYYLDSINYMEDILRETNLMGVHAGDVVEVLVHKDDPRINFYVGKRGRRR